MSTAQRFIVRREPPPDPKPTGWRGMYVVIDTLTSLRGGIVVAKRWFYGEAFKLAGQRNREHQHAVAVGARQAVA